MGGRALGAGLPTPPLLLTAGLPYLPVTSGRAGRGVWRPAHIAPFHFRVCVPVAKTLLHSHNPLSFMGLCSKSTLPTVSPTWQSGKELGNGGGRDCADRPSASLYSKIGRACVGKE